MSPLRAAPLLILPLLFAALIVLAPSGVRAQEAPLDVAIQVDPPTATVGDLVTLRLIVDHGDDVIVTARPPVVREADLVESPIPQTESRGGGRERTIFEFVVQPFALGTLAVDTVTLDWLHVDSSSGSVTVTSPPVQVAPVRAPGDTELRPLKPQMEVPGAPPAWIRPAGIAGVAVAALVTLSLAAFLLWRRFRAPSAAPFTGLTAEDRARAMLDTLVGRPLHNDEDFQLYYGTISLTVRRYLEDRFGFKATALTTSQLARRLPVPGMDRWQARLVAGLLDRCDAAVYARRYPDPTSADNDLTMAYEIVELSRPHVEDPEREAVPA
jgi:hypothetical protein